MQNIHRTLAAAILPAILVVGLGAGSASAGKSASTGGGGHTSYTGSFNLVLLDSTDGVPHFGQKVTFTVSSNAPYPSVTLTCYQNGSWVKNQTVGFYPGWAWSQEFPLWTSMWHSGAADCDGVLFYQTRKGNQTLASMSFHVEA